jgi:formylmethanofuran dehydrogenase subunit E
VFQNTEYLGDGWYEAKCEKCGEVFMFTTGDDIFAREKNGDVYPLCSKCYKGPQGTPIKKK